jgi:MOB kinase activator 1
MSFFNSLGYVTLTTFGFVLLTFVSRSMGRKGAPSTPTAAPLPSSRPLQSSNVDKSHSEGVRKKDEVAVYAPPPQPKLFLSSPFCEAALVKGSLKTLVSLPKYIDVMEWVAVNCKYSSH